MNKTGLKALDESNKLLSNISTQIKKLNELNEIPKLKRKLLDERSREMNKNVVKLFQKCMARARKLPKGKLRDREEHICKTGEKLIDGYDIEEKVRNIIDPALKNHDSRHADISAEINRLHQNRAKLAGDLVEIKTNLDKSKASYQKGLLNNFEAFTKPFRKRIESQKKSIKIAINEYIKTNAVALTNSMNVKWWKKVLLRIQTVLL